MILTLLGGRGGRGGLEMGVKRLSREKRCSDGDWYFLRMFQRWRNVVETVMAIHNS